jgi:hypothetical protein
MATSSRGGARIASLDPSSARGRLRVVAASRRLDVELGADVLHVGVDEGQFFPDLRAALDGWIREGRRVYVGAWSTLGPAVESAFRPAVESAPGPAANADERIIRLDSINAVGWARCRHCPAVGHTACLGRWLANHAECPHCRQKW